MKNVHEPSPSHGILQDAIKQDLLNNSDLRVRLTYANPNVANYGARLWTIWKRKPMKRHSEICSRVLSHTHLHTHRGSSGSPIFSHWQLSFQQRALVPWKADFLLFNHEAPVLLTICVLHVKNQSQCKIKQRSFLACFQWQQETTTSFPLLSPPSSGGILRKLYLFAPASWELYSPKNKTSIREKKNSCIKPSYTHANGSVCKVK